MHALQLCPAHEQQQPGLTRASSSSATWRCRLSSSFSRSSIVSRFSTNCSRVTSPTVSFLKACSMACEHTWAAAEHGADAWRQAGCAFEGRGAGGLQGCAFECRGAGGLQGDACWRCLLAMPVGDACWRCLCPQPCQQHPSSESARTSVLATPNWRRPCPCCSFFLASSKSLCCSSRSLVCRSMRSLSWVVPAARGAAGRGSTVSGSSGGGGRRCEACKRPGSSARRRPTPCPILTHIATLEGRHGLLA